MRKIYNRAILTLIASGAILMGRQLLHADPLTTLSKCTTCDPLEMALKRIELKRQFAKFSLENTLKYLNVRDANALHRLNVYIAALENQREEIKRIKSMPWVDRLGLAVYGFALGADIGSAGAVGFARGVTCKNLTAYLATLGWKEATDGALKFVSSRFFEKGSATIAKIFKAEKDNKDHPFVEGTLASIPILNVGYDGYQFGFSLYQPQADKTIALGTLKQNVAELEAQIGAVQLEQLKILKERLVALKDYEWLLREFQREEDEARATITGCKPTPPPNWWAQNPITEAIINSRPSTYSEGSHPNKDAP